MTIGELVNFPHGMDSCPCGILQTGRGGAKMEEKKENRTIIPPLPQVNTFPIVTDPFGSYTGLVHEFEEKPVQDADDL